MLRRVHPCQDLAALDPDPPRTPRHAAGSPGAPGDSTEAAELAGRLVRLWSVLARPLARGRADEDAARRLLRECRADARRVSRIEDRAEREREEDGHDVWFRALAQEHLVAHASELDRGLSLYGPGSEVLRLRDSLARDAQPRSARSSAGGCAPRRRGT